MTIRLAARDDAAEVSRVLREAFAEFERLYTSRSRCCAPRSVRADG